MDKKEFILNFMGDVWNEKRMEMIKVYVNETYHIKLDHADPWEGKILNHQEFKERLKYSFNSFSDINFEITNMISAANEVAITWIMRGKNDGFIEQIPPTNKRIETSGMTIYHFSGNKISGHTQVFDREKVMSQLGFLQ